MLILPIIFSIIRCLAWSKIELVPQHATARCDSCYLFLDINAIFLLQAYVVSCNLQLENYAKTEEAKVEELIKAVADSGAKVIVSGAAVGEMALHFCERYK